MALMFLSAFSDLRHASVSLGGETIMGQFWTLIHSQSFFSVSLLRIIVMGCRLLVVAVHLTIPIVPVMSWSNWYSSLNS